MRQDVFDRPFVDFFLKCIADHPIQLVGAGGFVQTHVANVSLGIGDAPAHVPVDHHTLLLQRQHRLRIRTVERQQALVDVRNVLERRRQLEVQPGFGNDMLDLTQRVNHAVLALIDNKHH
jgi:hypothetical protein